MMAERDHSQRNWAARATSGLPPLATELRTSQVIRFVPTSDIMALRTGTLLAKAPYGFRLRTVTVSPISKNIRSAPRPF
jgi:hypothetical protein